MSKTSEPGRPRLRIAAAAMSTIGAAVMAAGQRECMGLLACPPASDPVVSQALVLDAKAGAGRAEARAPALHAGVRRILDSGHVPAGLWHSHGLHPVYESPTDVQTFLRLSPALAAHDLSAPQPRSLAPRILGPALAQLPTADAWFMEFRLLGAPIPLAHAREVAAWASVTVALDPSHVEPVATLRPGRLDLAGGGVHIGLGVPDRATVVSTRVDAAPYRTATTFSLVVNRHGCALASSRRVVDAGGRLLVGESEICAIELVGCEGPFAFPAGVAP